ncbi:MAG: hybrid sensor histidine kinase/response regulator [Cellvibrionales bacterium]|nr:MAG: hybrid sensor histidine kinase/response regulator [Cellvibrionales bacterium]
MHGCLNDNKLETRHFLRNKPIWKTRKNVPCSGQNTMMPRSKIQLRIILPTIMLLATSAIFLYSAWHRFDVVQEHLIEDQIKHTYLSLGLLKQEIEYHSSQPEPIANAQRLLMSQNIDDGFKALAIINPSGQILANRFGNDIQEAINLPHFTHPHQPQPDGQNLSDIRVAADGQSIQAYISLRPESEQALLYASFDLSEAKATLWQQVRSDFYTIWLMTGLLFLAMAMMLERIVTRPLAKLVAFSQQITNDHFGQQNTGFYVGEIALLNQALNTMSSRISRTINELNTQQENLEVTLYSIGDAVITTDDTGLVTRMNPVAEQLTGWYAYEARGLPLKNIFSIIDASTREAIPNPVDKVLSTGKTVYLSNHTTLIAKNGSEYQIADSAAPIRDAEDRITGMVLVFNDVTEAYQLRQAARNIQQQIESLFNDMQSMAVILNCDGTVTFTNNTPLKFRGITADDVFGKKLWDCPWFDYSSDLQSSIQDSCAQAAAGKQTTIDIQISNAQGQIVWIEYNAHPVLNEEGQVVQILAEGHDISLRKKAEEELSTSLQHIKLYREQTPLATIEWNMDFQIENWNEAASKLFGYTLNEVKGRSANIIVPDSAKAEVNHVWNSAIQRSGGEININQNITKEGHLILCEWHNRSIVNQAGEVVGMASLVLDVTAVHKAKLALIKKEQEQREILNTLVEGIITVNDRGEVLSMNPAAAQIFGYTNEEINGQNLSLIIPNYDFDKVHQYIERTLTAATPDRLCARQEIVGLRKNKTTFPLQIAVAELPSAADGTRRFIGSCNDLTETKFQQEHLQRTQKMDALGKIVGGVAHDYNNMLSVILGYTDLMAIKYQDIEGLEKYIDNISQAGERGRDLTKRMLAFSRQENSQPEAIELHSLLAEQKELLSKSITALIKFEYKLCDSPWPLWLAPGELEDTLLNLAINAKYAMPNGGTLTLATQKRSLSFADARTLGLAEGDYMELNVSDDGSGISEEYQNKIFDPFFTTKGSEGTGLGLSQAYGFMDRCGGAIRVDSSPGVGTTFSLYFPRYEGAITHQAIQTEKPVLSSVNAEKILIVDDEPALRELTQEILNIAGYSVLSAGNASAALAILEKEAVDVMISDIIMPKMNGYDLAKIVSAKYPRTKIQLASGYSSEQAINEGQEQLHSNILRKPFRSSELLNTIAELLESKNNVH